MSDNQPKAQQVRKRSDQECIQMQFGQFLQFLQNNGIPTPTTAELRIMLYSSLYVVFDKQMKDYQNQALEQLRGQLPQVQQAMQEFQQNHAPKPPENVIQAPIQELEKEEKNDK